MIRALLFLLALASPVSAETARILSGEHGDFTRLVIELPGASGWTLGRTDQGYAFAAEAGEQPTYDLTAVWQRIPQTRLQSLQADPKTGVLELTLACDCHIFPFEYQPGVIVLDIKPGPAPEASAFEAAYAGPSAAVPLPKAQGETRAYDWLAGLGTVKAAPAATLRLPLDTGAVSLEPLRGELLEQIARGAADGIVDMELPGKPRKPVVVNSGALPWSNIRIGERPGVVVTNADDFVEGATPLSTCVDAALVDLPSWADGRPPYALLATARKDLYGEFDAPEPDAILLSVRLLLYLGFGAEAGQTADLIGREPTGKALPFYRSMARIIDGESDPQTPFASMLDCDGPAALWAALAHDRLPAGSGVNRDAILQAFAALPAHLRRHLGAALAEKFLAHDDAEAARIIRDAMERAPDADKSAVALLDAKTELHQGNTEAAQADAETAVALDGDQVDNLVALVESHFHTLDPIGPDVALALMALQGEASGTTDGPAVERAIVLALALSGQTEAAFAEEGAADAVLADLWRVAEDRATDDAFLLQAVLPADSAVPQVPPDTGLAVADRLLTLGFPDAAQVWLGPITLSDPPGRRLLAARAAIGQGDARNALTLAEGLEGPEAEAVRARALVQLGDLAAAGKALTAAGQTEAAVRLGPWQEDWAALDPALPEPWLQVASVVTSPPPIDAPGLLGRGGQAVEASLASRAAIEALLVSVASPAVQ